MAYKHVKKNVKSYAANIKVDIDERKVDSDISESIANKLKDTSTKTIDHVLALYNTFATV